MENVDLHCHSRASDGLLAPAEIVLRAQSLGVTTLALTDHDDTSGLEEAAEAAHEARIRFVPGVEISVTWNGTTVHVVGLGIDPGDSLLAEGLKRVRGGRTRRAARIAEALAGAGIPGSLEGAMTYVQNPDLISRTHFARFLVDNGYARDVGSVFRNYLVRGKPGYVPHHWSELGDALKWIRSAGGIAVLAHPARYNFAGEELHRFWPNSPITAGWASRSRRLTTRRRSARPMRRWRGNSACSPRAARIFTVRGKAESNLAFFRRCPTA